jgi:hypothetical protein
VPGHDHRVDQGQAAKQIGAHQGDVERHDPAERVAGPDQRAVAAPLQIGEHIGGQVAPRGDVGGAAAGPERARAVAEHVDLGREGVGEGPVRLGGESVGRREVQGRAGPAEIEVVFHRWQSVGAAREPPLLYITRCAD